MLKYVLIAFAAAYIVYLTVSWLKRRFRTSDKTGSGDDGTPYYSAPSPAYGGKDCKGSTSDDSSYGDCGSSDSGGDGGGGDGGGD